MIKPLKVALPAIAYLIIVLFSRFLTCTSASPPEGNIPKRDPSKLSIWPRIWAWPWHDLVTNGPQGQIKHELVMSTTVTSIRHRQELPQRVRYLTLTTKSPGLHEGKDDWRSELYLDRGNTEVTLEIKRTCVYNDVPFWLFILDSFCHRASF